MHIFFKIKLVTGLNVLLTYCTQSTFLRLNHGPGIWALEIMDQQVLWVEFDPLIRYVEILIPGTQEYVRLQRKLHWVTLSSNPVTGILYRKREIWTQRDSPGGKKAM